MRTVVSALLGIVFLSSCMKEELPVPSRPRGDARSITVCTGTAYSEQVWFDLSGSAVVSTNPKTAWDLAFESAPDGWRIMLNGSRMMTVWNRGQVDLSLPMDTAGMGIGRRIDAPSGHPDSTAIGDWRNTGNVYLIDLGFNAFGASMGMRKVRFTAVDASGYTFTSAMLDGSGISTHTVPRDPQRSQTYFKFGTGVVNIAPPGASWDMVFTQYTHQFYEPFLPYLVAGVLIDPTTTRVARIPNADFAQVKLADTLSHPFSNRRDIIGYDWKTYSFETSSFTVDHTLCYIIRDAQGLHHKLHFVGFYNEFGQAGCPTFEVAEL
jgi:hypothetical protein